MNMCERMTIKNLKPKNQLVFYHHNGRNLLYGAAHVPLLHHSQHLYFLLSIAPEGEPLNVSVAPDPPDALSVLWEPPNCLLWNSRRITSYTVHYTSLASPPQQEEEVREGGLLKYQLTGLDSFRDYSVWVSASNDQGRGPPSDRVTASLVSGEPFYL